MRSASRVLCVALALALPIGCNDSSSRDAKAVESITEPPANPPEPLDPEAPAEARATHVVWARDTAGEPASYRIDEEGRLLEKLDGIRIVVDGVEWRWNEERIRREMPASGCGEPEDESPSGEGEDRDESFVTRASVARADGSAAQDVVLPPMQDDEAADSEHIVKLLRSLGPYLFVRQSNYVYGCGAHGNLGASALIWDIAHNREVELDGELSEIEALRSQAERILLDADDALVSEGDEVTLSEVMPKFTEEGGLSLNLRFTGFACYACSDEEWSSYTKSVFLTAPKLPATLAPYSDIPAPVRKFAKEHPELDLGGFSVRDVSVDGPAARKDG